jgi:competence protein ComEA
MQALRVFSGSIIGQAIPCCVPYRLRGPDVLNDSDGTYDNDRYFGPILPVYRGMKTHRRTIIRTLLGLAGLILLRRWSTRRERFHQERGAAKLAWSSRPGHRKIDLNRAAIDELATLPGIGPGLAGRIIAYRRWIGPFHEPDDLLLVPGMSSRKLALIRDVLIATSP